jgi:ABC-type sugar transport system ATPase subunit
MLYVTHDQVEAMTMGDKIAVMNKGELEQFGSPAEVYEKPASAFVARFLGSPAMNLLSGGIVTEGGRSIFVINETDRSVRIPLASAVSPQNVQLGIRPEQTRVEAGDQVGGGGTAMLTGKLILIEPIGSVTHYYIDWPGAAGGALVASVTQTHDAKLQNLKLGDSVSFEFPSAALHLFDRESGKRINY